jgi:predicted permease
MRLPWRRTREDADAALDEELRAHFAMAIADRIARGESPDDAVNAVRREFGNVTHVKEVTREMWGTMWIERLVQDLRYALRSLRRAPAFAIVAVLTLALGIGVNSAMFAVMNGVLLRPLPYPSPERLFAISYQPPAGPFNNVRGLYDAHFVALEKDRRARSIFSHVATFGSPSVTLRGVGEPKLLAAGAVTPDFFATLGTHAALGRVFTVDDPVDTRDRVAVISDRLWHDDFAADPNIVGKTIDIDNTKRTVIGVMPASFNLPAHADVWTPLTIQLSDHETRTRAVVGRLADGVPIERASAAWKTIVSSFTLFPGAERNEFIAELVPLKTFVVGDAERPLLIFGGAVAFVLLIACANVANLLLMRVTTREREMAVRAALGAGRRRLIRQLLTETFTISAIGSVLGVAVAVVAMKLLLLAAPSDLVPRVENVRVDASVLLFTALLVAGTTILCGVLPALHASDDHLRGSLADGARTMTQSRGRVRALLVVSEIALAFVLLIGAALMVRSFDRMQSVKLGFTPENTLTMSVSLPADRYRTGADMRRYHDGILAGLEGLPGVAAVAAVNWLPFSHALIAGDFQVEGGAKLPGRWADKMVVTPSYFRAIGQRIVQGRAFAATDGANAPRVAIMSKSVAEKLWPGGTAIGHRIAMTDTPEEKDWIRIVGVVDDVVQNSVTEKPDPAVYEPMAQVDFPFFLATMSYVVRSDADPAPTAAAMRQIIQRADPSLPLTPVHEFSDLIQLSMLTPRFQSRVLLVFSSLALALAVVGIYGVLAYGVTQRLREIGVRVALGADPRGVRTMILGRTAALALPGLAIGVAGSLALTRVLSRFLFQITPTDPPTFIGVGLLLAGVAFAAAYLPAKRASEVDPIVVLRGD